MLQILSLAVLLLTASARITVPLNNGIHKTAHYTATIYLGSQLSPFEVQVDTGSAKLAIPCQACQECPARQVYPKFVPSASTTHNPLFCNSNANVCQITCSDFNPNTRCPLDQTYVDNSWIRGVLFTDNMALTSTGAGRASNDLGCILELSPQFKQDKTIDGIWGTGKSVGDSQRGYLVMDHYITEVSKQQGQTDRIFSICMAEQGGEMSVGGVNTALHNPSYPELRFPYDSAQSDLVGKSLGAIKVGNTVVHNNAGSLMPQAILDSGSTVSLLHPTIYKAITDQLKAICDSRSDICEHQTYADQNDLVCFFMKEYSQISIFPQINVGFGSGFAPWFPHNYFNTHNLQDPTYCVHFTPINEPHYLFGDDFMIDKDIVFERETVSIFSESRCKGSSYPNRASSVSSSTQGPNLASQQGQAVVVSPPTAAPAQPVQPVQQVQPTPAAQPDPQPVQPTQPFEPFQPAPAPTQQPITSPQTVPAQVPAGNEPQGTDDDFYYEDDPLPEGEQNWDDGQGFQDDGYYYEDDPEGQYEEDQGPFEFVASSGQGQSTQSSSSSDSEEGGVSVLLIGLLAGGLTLLGVITLAIFCYRRLSKQTEREESEPEEEPRGTDVRFSVKEHQVEQLKAQNLQKSILYRNQKLEQLIRRLPSKYSNSILKAWEKTLETTLSR